MPETYDPFDRGDYVFLADGFARDVAEGRLDDAASWVEAACEVRAGNAATPTRAAGELAGSIVCSCPRRTAPMPREAAYDKGRVTPARGRARVQLEAAAVT